MAVTLSTCERCVVAGNRERKATSAPEWDPKYRICRACLAAVLWLLDATGTRPEPAGDGFTFLEHPAHTGAPHFLWNPHKDGLAAQVAGGLAATRPPEAPRRLAAGADRRLTDSGHHSESERRAS